MSGLEVRQSRSTGHARSVLLTVKRSAIHDRRNHLYWVCRVIILPNTSTMLCRICDLMVPEGSGTALLTAIPTSMSPEPHPFAKGGSVAEDAKGSERFVRPTTGHTATYGIYKFCVI